ncbi:MAG TPA: hypothetical protein VHH90_09590 [Polyangia bacterium]|nr:hypothetical protein [Polyangia bacterium]
MTSRRLAWVLVACAVGAGCGNYSNEDLEYMAAVPTTTELAVELPAAANAVVEAELAKKTHDAIKTVNDSLTNVLALVDGVRGTTPTSRSSDSRTWGPFDDDKHPGWRWELIVTRDLAAAATFTYRLLTENPAAATGWLVFVSGSFDAAGGAKQGTGQVTADFASLGSKGFPLDAGAANLATLTIAYQNFDRTGSPIEVSMTINSVPDASGAATTLSIVYEILSDRSGEMAFTLTGNLIAGPATEVVQVNSQWLPSGAGESTLEVASGDGAGLAQTECWDSVFAATFNSKPWARAEDLGSMDACPTLPPLAPLAP